jgi:carbonic anhydrase/SulP family sulfate permease
MPHRRALSPATIPRDLIAGVVVFLVALPLCLGVALASGAPLFAGLVAGIVGGMLVGSLSGSHTSVSGPAAGLTAVVAAQIESLGSFHAFLLAVVAAGAIQVGLGCARAGFIAAFFPSSVIKGLLAAIGVIIILKQIPHLVGHDTDPEGEFEFWQPDQENTFSEIGKLLGGIHPGAALVGFASLALLMTWDRIEPLKKSLVPPPLVAVIFGVAVSRVLAHFGGTWTIEAAHLVQVPVADSLQGFAGFLQFPDFARWTDPAIYTAAVTIALVASLETLLNLEAVDKLDPLQRRSPASRELVAQGVGNMMAGMVGGIPVTSVIIRSSVNINAGSRTKLSSICHGLLLLVCVVLLPTWLNMIPLSCLAAILLVTGAKLASPKLMKQMWDAGRSQFAPFAVTVIAIVATDLLVGVLIGLAVSIGFILDSNLRRPMRRFLEKHLGGEVLHIELANQVSFLNRAALARVLDGVPRGGHVLLDAQNTDYIDPDVLDLIRDFKEQTAPARRVELSVKGFREKYRLKDQIQYVDFSTRELQSAITPQQVLQVLTDGNERFRTGRQLTRDLGRQVIATASGQHPLAVVLSCIDSRTPAELIFDLGVGDIFSVRVAGNITSRKVLGSIEYGCAVAGAKLVLVLGHTRCGAVTAAVELAGSSETVAQATGCRHVEYVIGDIQQSIDGDAARRFGSMSAEEKQDFIDEIARVNVLRTVRTILEQSDTIADLVHQGRIAIAGALYDVATGEITVMSGDVVDDGIGRRDDVAGLSSRLP